MKIISQFDENLRLAPNEIPSLPADDQDGETNAAHTEQANLSQLFVVVSGLFR